MHRPPPVRARPSPRVPRARRIPGPFGPYEISCSLHAAEQVVETQSPDHPRRLPDDAAVHLGDAGAAVHEHDRDLLDSKTLLPALEGHLDLERIAVRAHPIEADRLQRAAPEALEAAGRVVHGEPGDQAG